MDKSNGTGASAQPGAGSKKEEEEDVVRVQPLMFSVTMPRKFQKPGSQRSHFCPPTPGLQEH